MKTNKKLSKTNNKPNKKIIFQSILALICIFLTFKVDWLFIIPAIALVWLNQKELFKK